MRGAILIKNIFLEQGSDEWLAWRASCNSTSSTMYDNFIGARYKGRAYGEKTSIITKRMKCFKEIESEDVPPNEFLTRIFKLGTDSEKAFKEKFNIETPPECYELIFSVYSEKNIGQNIDFSIAISPDIIIKNTPVEIKTQTVGKSWNGNPPKKYIFQLAMQCIALQSETGYLIRILKGGEAPVEIGYEIYSFSFNLRELMRDIAYAIVGIRVCNQFLSPVGIVKFPSTVLREMTLQSGNDETISEFLINL